jgi:hypothetical protein
MAIVTKWARTKRWRLSIFVPLSLSPGVSDMGVIDVSKEKSDLPTPVKADRYTTRYHPCNVRQRLGGYQIKI